MSMDHNVLLWTLNMTDLTGKFAHWRSKLPESKSDDVHGAAIKHQAADELSRTAKTETATCYKKIPYPSQKFPKILLHMTGRLF